VVGEHGEYGEGAKAVEAREVVGDGAELKEAAPRLLLALLAAREVISRPQTGGSPEERWVEEPWQRGVHSQGALPVTPA
jgi:hypothetical protein